MLKEIKSKLILKIIFGNLKKKNRLKLLKHNKYLQSKLNIRLNDFIAFKLLKDLNKKYNLDIPDIYIKKLKLKLEKNNFNEIMAIINQIKFYDLNEFYLISSFFY